MTDIRDILDGDAPFGSAPHWIVQFQVDFDERDMVPLDAAEQAYGLLKDGHTCLVTHVPSGMMWSIDLARREIIEVVTRTPER